MSFDEPAARPGPRPTGATGLYRLDLATQTWWWSDGVYTLHGFAPGEVVPTTELVLAHQHPADRSRVARFLTAPRPTDEPFGTLHRLVDAEGHERSVVVVSQVEQRGAGASDGRLIHGCATEVSEPVHEWASTVATRQIQESSRSRGTIERAKGALAAIYPVDPDAAFEMMRLASNHRNTPLREIAEAVLDLVTDATPRRRAGLDALLTRDVGGPGRTGHPATAPRAR